MRFYYVHPESGSAFATDDPPDVVMEGGDGCVEEVPYEVYRARCIEWGIEPEFEDLGI